MRRFGWDEGKKPLEIGDAVGVVQQLGLQLQRLRQICFTVLGISSILVSSCRQSLSCSGRRLFLKPLLSLSRFCLVVMEGLNKANPQTGGRAPV